MVPFQNILIICHANTCRSVIAEALLRRMIDERGVSDAIEVRSGGVAAYARDGALVSMDARLVLRDEGIMVAPDAVSTDLKRNRHLVSAADLILAMTSAQIVMLREGFPESQGKPVHTLKDFAGIVGDIDDPVGQGEDVYAACRDEIKVCLVRVIDRLTPLSILARAD